MSKTKIPTADELRAHPLEGKAPAIYDAMNERLKEIEALGERAKQTASEKRATDFASDQLRALDLMARELQDLPVDFGQVISTGGDTIRRDADLPILTRGQSFRQYTDRKGLTRSNPDGEVRFGALLRTWVTGRREHCNDAELRALAEGTTTAGGYLVPAETAGFVIDRARNISRVMQAGATTVPMESHTLRVPKLTGSSAPAWRAENASIASADMTFGAVELKAKSLAFLVKISRELVEDSDPSAISVVEGDLAKQVALEIDRVALRGTGVEPEPKGVLNTAGVTVTTHGAAGAEIGTGAGELGWDVLVDAQGAVRAANFEPSAQILAPRSETAFAKLKGSDGHYIRPPAALDGLTRYPTNQVPTNLTVGASTDCSEIYTGDWTNLYFGLRTGAVTTQLVERYADVGQIGLLIWFRADIALAHGEAFVVDTGVRGAA